MAPVWPLTCSGRKCRAFTYPRAATLADAYIEASMHGWTVQVHHDGQDILLCPRCSPPLPPE